MEPPVLSESRYVESPEEFATDPRVKTMVSMAGTNGTVLDLGCLDGLIGEMIMARGNVVHGIDSSAAAVEKALQRGIKAQVGDLEKGIDFPPSQFDVVLAGEIMEHICDVDLFLSEIHRVLKPDGFLVLSTPNLAALGRRLLLLFNRNPHIEISFRGGAAGHVRYFIKRTLVGLLEKNGFSVRCFTSDVINLSAHGGLRLVRLAKVFPSLGRSLIVKAARIGR